MWRKFISGGDIPPEINNIIGTEPGVDYRLVN